MKSNSNSDKVFEIDWQTYAKRLLLIDVVFAISTTIPWSVLYLYPKIDNPFYVICLLIGALGIITFTAMTVQIIINLFIKASFRFEFTSSRFEFSWPSIISMKSIKCDYSEIDYLEVLRVESSEGGSTEDAVIYLKNGETKTINVMYGIPWNIVYKEFQARGVVVKWNKF